MNSKGRLRYVLVLMFIGILPLAYIAWNLWGNVPSTHYVDEGDSTIPQEPTAGFSLAPKNLDIGAAVDTPLKKPKQRFIKLTARGLEYVGNAEWQCVLDQQNQLVWEVKRKDGSWQDHEFKFSWFKVNTEQEVSNGTEINGLENGGECFYINCDTEAYAIQMNRERICGIDNWRLPTKNELISLDHPSNYSPDIDTRYFPNTKSGFYWSSTESASNSDIAFAIDFHNNIGYATEKRLAYFIRAVADANANEN